MPLNYNNISPSASLRLKYSEATIRNTLTRATALNRGSTIDIPCDWYVHLPLRKSYYGTGVSETFRRDFYFELLETCLLGKDYKVYLHDPGIYYVAIPNFNSVTFPRKFDVFLEPTFIATLRSNIQDRSKTDFFIGANGPWFDKSGNLYGKAYSEGALQTVTSSVPGNTSLMYVQWNSPNTLTLDIGEASGGDGFSSLPKFIIDGDIQNIDDVRSKPGVGRHIFAYHPAKDLVFIIVRENELKNTANFNIDEVAEMLVFLGFKKAAFFDGSTSVYLYEYNYKGEGRTIIDCLTTGKNIALDLGYGIKKDNTATSD